MKPRVGVTVLASSSKTCASRLVLPALSRPRVSTPIDGAERLFVAPIRPTNLLQREPVSRCVREGLRLKEGKRNRKHGERRARIRLSG
eukprot:scaffold126411_cov60-Phaeocystis_antarctica.AAC.1